MCPLAPARGRCRTRSREARRTATQTRWRRSGTPLAWDGSYHDEYVPTTYTYLPTGQLSLAITNVERLPVQTTRNDRKRQRLETRLTDFVAHLSTVAPAMKLQREEDQRRRIAALGEAERRRIGEIEEERRRWARQQHRWAEEEREKKLLAELERWRLAQGNVGRRAGVLLSARRLRAAAHE